MFLHHSGITLDIHNKNIARGKNSYIWKLNNTLKEIHMVSYGILAIELN